jgi:hypothetical protein
MSQRIGARGHLFLRDCGGKRLNLIGTIPVEINSDFLNFCNARDRKI